MMAEILTEKGICDACGNEVRQGSSFCFSCGKSVVIEPPPPPIRKPATRSLDGPPNGNLMNGGLTDLEPPPVPAPTSEPIMSAAVGPPAQPTSETRPRPARNRKLKTVEVEWVRQDPSATRFLIFSLLMAAIAAGLVAAAIYLR